jgi:glycosyltransferase involved in cell wall biosynthesis
MPVTKPRVLIVAHGHPELSPGGGEIVAYEMFRALRATGKAEAFYMGAMLPRFGMPHCGAALLPANQDPAQTLYWSDRYNFFLLSQDNIALMLEEFGRYLAAVQPDVVHFHHVHNLGVETIRMVKTICPKAKIFLTLHEFLAICHHNGQMVKTNTYALCHKATPADCGRCFPNVPSGEFFLRERFIKAHYDLVDMFFCPSKFLMSRYLEWGIPKHKIMYVENGHAAANEKRPLVAAPGDRSFAYFGQVSPYKGLPILLDAVKYLIDQKFENFRVDIHGSILFLSNDQESDLRRRMAEVQSHVRFHGAYRPDDVVGLMGAVDWVIVPSIWWENSPLVIEEAFMARRPVISSNIGGMAEKVRHEVDGLHFRVGDAIALAETMMRAAGDPALHARLTAGIRTVHSMSAMAQEHLGLYARHESAPAEPPRPARMEPRAAPPIQRPRPSAPAKIDALTT